MKRLYCIAYNIDLTSIVKDYAEEYKINFESIQKIVKDFTSQFHHKYYCDYIFDKFDNQYFIQFTNPALSDEESESE